MHFSLTEPTLWRDRSHPGPGFPTRESDRPAEGNYWNTWFATYERKLAHLKTQSQTHYWETWFDLYSQYLSRHFQSSS